MMPKAAPDAPDVGAKLFGERMLQFFRNFFGSKIGVGVTLGFLGLIALAFASGDVASSGGFGGIAGGDRVASAGGSRVSTSELERAAGNAVEQLREQEPTLTMRGFLAKGGLDELLGNLIDLSAIREFGESHGVYVGDRLVDSEIAKIPSVQGPDGKVDERAYRAFLAQKGITDAQLRRELTEAIMARQLLSPSGLGAAMPNEATLRYAAVVAERRKGVIALLPSAAFAPKAAPSDAEVTAWYGAHQQDYMLPERRSIRYASFTDAVLKSVPAPTEAEIAARYGANKARYAASEARKITQLVVPTDAAAKAVLTEVNSGKSLEAVAAAKGLSAASLGSLSKEALSGQSSASVADAAFAAQRGQMIGPIKGPLGWLLLRVDAVEGKPGKTLDQARAELVPAIASEKRRAALTDFSARIEEEFENGASLADVAKELGLTLSDTGPLLADGQLFGKPVGAPELLARIIPTAFSMERENQPQLAEVEPGKTFLVFDVGAIAQAAPPPLAMIRTQVATDVQLSKGAVAARAAAKKLEEALKKGGDPASVMAGFGVALPPVDRVDMPRQQLQSMGQQVPPPLAAFFSMSRGHVILLAAPRNRGWYVISLKEVIPGQVDPKDPRLAQLQASLARYAAEEYSEQLRIAMRKEVGVERNETAIKAVRTRLNGGN